MILFGAGGHAKVVIDILESMGERIDGLVDANGNLKELFGYPVWSEESYKGDFPMIVSIGDNAVRKKLSDKYPVKYGIAVHPSAIVSSHATIGEGSVVMPTAVINAGAKVGRHCIINTGAIIEHENEIGDYVHISPNVTLCGNVKVGEGTWIGARAIIPPGVKIGKWCRVLAGRMVSRDLPDGHCDF